MGHLNPLRNAMAFFTLLEFPRLFFIELQKYGEAKYRLSKTKLFLESIDFDDKAATGAKNFSTMKSDLQP